jgi:class 3 adenylate cyclase
MSELADKLADEVEEIAKSAWDYRDGEVVPDVADLALGNEAVKLEATMLYADLADSTELAIRNREQGAEVFKAYLRGVTRLIRSCSGDVRSFDGDRVMGVFISGNKNTNAARCGLQINWFFNEVLITKFKEFYSSLEDFPFEQTVGIDNGTLSVIRSGIRSNNDLVWVGRAPNIAAKLSGIRGCGYPTLITESVYNSMLDDSKLGGLPKTNMWVELNWTTGKGYGVGTLYGSNWLWTP